MLVDIENVVGSNLADTIDGEASLPPPPLMSSTIALNPLINSPRLVPATGVPSPTPIIGCASETLRPSRYFFGDGDIPNAISADARYVIDELTGVISINRALDLDDPTPRPGTYRVLAFDNHGGAQRNMAEVNGKITITDVNEPNDLPELLVLDVAENQGEHPVYTVTAGDADGDGENAGQSYGFLVDNVVQSETGDGKFAIDAVTGVITALVSLDSRPGTRRCRSATS